MIAGGGGTGEGWVCAGVLRLLLAPAFARNLHIGAAEGGITRADLDGCVDGGNAGDPLAGYVILEFCRSPFACGVIEHSLFSDWGEGDHGVDGEGLPNSEAEAAFAYGLELLGKDGGIGGGFEDFLCDFA